MNKFNELGKFGQERAPVKFLTIDSAYENQRIDNFLTSRLKGLPKSHLYRIIRKGEVRVNKKRIKPDYRLKAGDIVRIPPLQLNQPNTGPAKLSSNLQVLLEGNILYEDKALLIINKPAGMAVHGGSGIQLGLIEALRVMRPQEKTLELVHRLDRETSGCILLAKKPSVLKELHELLRNGEIEKTYLTLVQGHWPKYMHEVDAPLKKNQLQSGERMVNVNPEGKSAVTEFRVIERFAAATLVEAKPKTGRTHQIRVHTLHAGHPIAADDKYGDKDFNKSMKDVGCRRLFLHASELKFSLSIFENPIIIKAELADDLQECLKKLPK